jgi:hypothetical protein
MKDKENQADPFGIFDFGQFRKWINEQNDKKNSDITTGLEVESKISYKKLLNKILEVNEGEKIEIAKQFRRFGGVILETNGPNFLIETPKGSFYIEKIFIKQKDF